MSAWVLYTISWLGSWKRNPVNMDLSGDTDLAFLLGRPTALLRWCTSTSTRPGMSFFFLIRTGHAATDVASLGQKTMAWSAWRPYAEPYTHWCLEEYAYVPGTNRWSQWCRQVGNRTESRWIRLWTCAVHDDPRPTRAPRSSIVSLPRRAPFVASSISA